MAANKTIFHSDAEPSFMRFPSRRSTVLSTKGIVSCSQPLAARAGIKILQQGGNAADAAVATAAALNITEPCKCGIGGDMFCLFYNAKTKKTYAMNGSGRSPAGYTLEDLRKDIGLKDGDIGEMPIFNVRAATVPGAAAGLVDTVEKFGSGKLSLEQILEPAIELGEEGFPVTELTSQLWQTQEDFLKKASPNGAEMLKEDPQAPGGYRAPLPGDIFRNRNLANTFRLLGKLGKKGFYEGSVAKAIVEVVHGLGGKMSLADLKNHADHGSEAVEPISLKFDGQGIAEPVELWEHPPNGQGLVALIALGIVQELEKSRKIKKFNRQDHNTAEYLHVIIEALRLAFSDGTHYIGDPDFVKVPVDELLSSEYLAKRASAFSKDKAIASVKHGTPLSFSSNTVYFSTADPYGNACSFIMSNYMDFGTGIVPKGCGFTLQNRGANFFLQPPEHYNIYAPGKRPYHTIIPAMITNQTDGSLNTCYGVMGGFMQPQGHLQVFMNLLVFGMTPQEALDAPRICIEAVGPDGISKAGVDEVYIEQGISQSAIDGLKKRGHNVFVLEEYERDMFGRGQVIRKSEEDGILIWSAGSDPRADGQSSPL